MYRGDIEVYDEIMILIDLYIYIEREENVGFLLLHCSTMHCS